MKTEIIIALVLVFLSIICFIAYILWIKPKQKKDKRKNRNALHMDAFFIPPTDTSHHIHMDSEQFQGFGNGGSFGGGGASGDWNPDVADAVESSQGLFDGIGETLGTAAESAGDAIGDIVSNIDL